MLDPRLLTPLLTVPMFVLSSCGGLPALGDNAFGADEDPAIAALRSLSKEDGICAIFDAHFDASFSPNEPLLPENGHDLTFMEDPNYPLNTADDGPFGQAWQAFVKSEGPLSDNVAENLNRLSTEQCGYPVMDTMKATFRRNCLTPIDETTGQRGKQTCKPLVDPRP